MTEAIKSVIWRKEDNTINGKKVYKYLIGTILVTEEPIGGIGPGDNIAMAEIPSDLHMFTKAFGSLPKYKSPHTLGDLSNAILDIADMTPEQLRNTLDDEETI